MKSYQELISTSAAAHGHLCPGQVVGVRMAMLGCRLIGLEDPASREQIKKLIVYVEMDRCTADAVAHVTGVRLGRRSLKHFDFGIMAASFVNLETRRAYRIISTESARDLVHLYAPGVAPRSRQQIDAYERMPESVLFRVQQVEVSVAAHDLPGPTRSKVRCQRCGQMVRDGREVLLDGAPCCRICAGAAYFSNPREITWPDMNRTPLDRHPGKRVPLGGRGPTTARRKTDETEIRHSSGLT